MPVRKAHGNAKKTGQIMVVEAPKADELPAGVHETPQVEARGERSPNGRWRKGCSTQQSRGGKARKQTTVLSHKLGLDTLMAQETFRPHLAAAKAFHKRVCGDIARDCGGGECPPMAATMVMAAAMATAGAAYLFERATATGDPALFQQSATLNDKAKSALLAAWEISARVAKARQAQGTGKLDGLLQG